MRRKPNRDPNRPKCVNCSRNIRRRFTAITFGVAENPYDRSERYEHVYPKRIEDALPYAGERQVQEIRWGHYWNIPTNRLEPFVSALVVHDGYRDPFFCCAGCVYGFGLKAARSGFRMADQGESRRRVTARMVRSPS
jgi:hypothetical protein